MAALTEVCFRSKIQTDDWNMLTRKIVIHISEEIHQPGKRVPQVMIVTMLIGLLTTLPLFLVLLYCMTSLEGVITSPLPSLEIILQT